MTTTIKWICKECKGQPSFYHKDFLEHLEKVHDIHPGEYWTQEGVLFLDGKGFAERHYEVMCKGLKFYKIEVDYQRKKGAAQWPG